MADSNRLYDLAIVGGGINGAGIARDAAGRGLKVLLVERDDLAGHTSSASTKLIHGGLRYLEHLEFALVRKALAEREVLLNIAPHISRSMRFVVPHVPALRPLWLIRLGLFLYDHLSLRHHLDGAKAVDLRKHPAGQALRPEFSRGFEYADGWVDDARLVVLNCLDAAERGAVIATHTECVSAQRGEDLWHLQLRDAAGTHEATARALINATGPWVSDFLAERSPAHAHHHIRLIKGSHIVVPRIDDHGYAYLFQNEDRRIVFALPFEEDFTLIGTTDIEFSGELRDVKIDDDEIEYLCAMVSRYLIRPITRADVRASYSGVRPLLDDESDSAAAVTRDYTLELDTQGPPLLSVFGGKITTYRKLAEEAVASLQPLLNFDAPGWTAEAPLPGGEMPEGFEAFLQRMQTAYPRLPAALLKRWARAYGTRLELMLGGAASVTELGEEVLPGLYERELRYLIRHEWARTAADILQRRSKLGLHLGQEAGQGLQDWLDRHAELVAPSTRLSG